MIVRLTLFLRALSAAGIIPPFAERVNLILHYGISDCWEVP